MARYDLLWVNPFWSLSQFLSQTTEGPNQVVSEVPFCSVVPNANPRHVSIYFSFPLLNLAFKCISESGIGVHYLLPLPWAGGQMAVAASGGSSQVGHSASPGLQEPREGLQRPPGDWKGRGPAFNHPEEMGQRKEQEGAHPDNSAPRITSSSLGDEVAAQQLAWIPLQSQGPDNQRRRLKAGVSQGPQGL